MFVFQPVISVKENPLKTIWLVDNDEEDHSILEHAFQQTYPQIPPRSIFYGDELLPALLATIKLPALIILDWNMIRLEGLETPAAFQRAVLFDSIPLVLLTTFDQGPATRLGARGYHVRPFIHQHLIELTHQLARQWLV
ncbi:response regulator [Spirosoma aerophilum]